MNSDPSGPPPPDWLGRLLQQAQEGLRRASDTVGRAAERAVQKLTALASWVASESSRRWPTVRDRVVRWGQSVDGAAAKLLASVGPVVRGWAGELKRRAPSRRQTLLLVVVLLGPTWILWERCGVRGCPDVARLTSYQPGGASALVDRNGEPFADLAPMDYAVVPLDSLPEYVGDAFIAVEDRRFLEHSGVDWVRVLGAAWADIRALGYVQGSSTIPMQLSRTLFSDRIRREEKTLRRKLMEVRVAGEIEEHFTKEEILELYLNHVYLGGGSFGIQAASRYYFRKDATDLELEEAALLAALPKAPSNYNPRRRPEAARARRDLILTLMEEQELISFDRAQAARTHDLAVTAEPDRDRDGDRLAPYFVAHVRRLLEDALGEAIYDRRLRVVTTLDRNTQEAVEAELEAQLLEVERGTFGRLSAPSYQTSARPDSDETAYLQGAAVVMDVRQGDVRAWVGGRDYDHSRFDRALHARRQAGSAFKPFVYAAALEARFPPAQPILDAPFRLARRGARDWEPENYSGRFEGRMSMRDALVRSQNVPAARLAAAVGDERVRDFAERAGITGEVPASPVAALGVTDVSPLEMTVAYSGFAGLGNRPAPRFVLRVEDPDGEVLWETEPRTTQVTDTATAFMMTDLLRDVVDRGTGADVRSVGFRGSAAGKTGTTNDATDVWFVGYTPELVAAVWVGFDEVKPLPYRATGGGVAAPVWGRFMARVHEGRSPPDWAERPAGVVEVRVDPETGLALEDRCYSYSGEARLELFLAGDEPTTTCPRRGRRDYFDRFDDWFGSVFGSRRFESRIPGPRDPHLGVPRLPRRADAPASRGRNYDDHTSPSVEDDRDPSMLSARVPPGHHPPRGECRVWYPDRAPGRQPPPARCGSLVGRVPLGTFVLFNGRAWYTGHDWAREHSLRPGSVPEIVLHIMNTVVGD